MSRKRKRTGDDGRRKTPSKPARRPSPSTLDRTLKRVYAAPELMPTKEQIAEAYAFADIRAFHVQQVLAAALHFVTTVKVWRR